MVGTHRPVLEQGPSYMLFANLVLSAHCSVAAPKSDCRCLFAFLALQACPESVVRGMCSRMHQTCCHWRYYVEQLSDGLAEHVAMWNRVPLAWLSMWPACSFRGDVCAMHGIGSGGQLRVFQSLLRVFCFRSTIISSHYVWVDRYNRYAVMIHHHHTILQAE